MCYTGIPTNVSYILSAMAKVILTEKVGEMFEFYYAMVLVVGSGYSRVA